MRPSIGSQNEQRSVGRHAQAVQAVAAEHRMRALAFRVRLLIIQARALGRKSQERRPPWALQPMQPDFRSTIAR